MKESPEEGLDSGSHRDCSVILVTWHKSEILQNLSTYSEQYNTKHVRGEHKQEK